MKIIKNTTKKAKIWWESLNQSEQVIFTIKYFNLSKQVDTLNDKNILTIYTYEKL